MTQTAERIPQFVDVELLPYIDPEQLQIPTVRELVLKISSGCDLDCDYCYVYQDPNKDFLKQPAFMSTDTIRMTAYRLGEYLKEHPQLKFTIMLHGGEPLLAPKGYFDDLVEIFLDVVGEATEGNTDLDFAIQTNAQRLYDGNDEDGVTDRYLQELRRNGIRVGVSLDGDAEATQRHRKKRGRQAASSHDDVIAGLENMIYDERYFGLFSGFLSVVDTENDPEKTLETLLEYQPPFIDFLLPHGNWETPPQGLEPSEEQLEEIRSSMPEDERDQPIYERTEGTPYADWLIKVFEKWYPDEARRTRLRVFDAIIRGVIGRNSGAQSVGDNGDSGLVVVEGDGSFEMVDAYKTDPGRIAKTGLSVHKDTIEDAARKIAEKAHHLGADRLPDDCRPCPAKHLCNAAFEPWRFRRDPENPTRSKGTFNYRSVYCNDLYGYITEVEMGVVSRARKLQFERMRFQQEEQRQAKKQAERERRENAASQAAGSVVARAERLETLRARRAERMGQRAAAAVSAP